MSRGAGRIRGAAPADTASTRAPSSTGIPKRTIAATVCTLRRRRKLTASGRPLPDAGAASLPCIRPPDVPSSPGHMRHGLSRRNGGLRLAVWAPRTERLAVRVGERDAPLTPAPGGWWTIDLPALPAGTPYALVFPDGRVRPDPAAR